MRNEPLSIKLQPTFEDFAEGIALIQKRNLMRSRIIMGACAAIFGVAAYRFHAEGGWAAAWPWILGACLFLLLVALTPWRYRSALKRFWDKTPAISETSDLSISDAGLTWISDSGETHSKWSAYTHWVETTNLFVLFRGPKLPYPIPKRDFTTADAQDAFRKLLNERISDTSK